MRSVRVAKTETIERLGFSTEEEPGAVGAALLAESSLLRDGPAASDFLQRAHTPGLAGHPDEELSTR
jgi:hypothetical protein